MEIGIGLDQGLRLSFAEQRELVREAARLGYQSAWTPSSVNLDAFQTCALWNQATTDLVEGGLATGIAVVPAPLWSAPSLAAVAGTTAVLSGDRFVLGIGSGSVHDPAYRRAYGLPDWRPIALMRDYLIVLRGLLAGERVEYAGTSLELHGAQLAFRPPRVPICLGTLGEQMLGLAGELADGAALNWCTPRQVAWSRGRVVAGAQRAGRDPAAIKLVEYIRVCVDDDEDAARRAYTRALLGYALAKPGASKERGYRAHFARMGFDAALTELEERRARGASDDELVEAFPRELLGLVGYYGPAAGAASAFRRLSEGLDTAIVRVVPARPGVDAVRAVMVACRPDLVRAADRP